MAPLVLLRHGQSEWNLDNRFAGWMDVGLTATGVEQAQRTGAFMRQHGMKFDRCYTSVLKRAAQTARFCLESMASGDIPIEHHWRLNERHYGALHGLGKEAVAREFGEVQLRLWRRSYATRPPAASDLETDAFRRDPRYAEASVPTSESQADTVVRVEPFLKKVLRPALASGTRTLIVAHGTSLRAVVKLLCGISGSDMLKLEFPNGIPFLIEFGPTGRAMLPYGLHE
ncbi:2,3-diphosphoglycerate-dependent phosphoglycerate mutase [Variovorax sp. Sphag1AA]|uniref:2,3-bisphosphoglycerate-dependent phosphoglycerate mutase n=1 Tax=Variovorax sp. Sphag1AA TaxID=2587027 RepID=UPI00161B89AE|nr:2,3-bisphosphoglycerate-dependent phosphoglycerate mutase [Variovorax sp. Sphag1AA]MBB3181081.1 2,3-bisphosphoglycerate-dependent phosphoglycerate mutase [Variovorax sp. Sphag1AA]